MFSENRDLMSFFHWSIAVSYTVPGIVDTDGRTEGRKNGRMKGSLGIPLLLYFPFSKFPSLNSAGQFFSSTLRNLINIHDFQISPHSQEEAS